MHRSKRRAGLRRKKPDPIIRPINQTSDLLEKIPGRMKIEMGKTNQTHTRELMHSINNINGKRTQMFLSIQVQFIDPQPNQTDMTCQINRVHKVHLA